MLRNVLSTTALATAVFTVSLPAAHAGDRAAAGVGISPVSGVGIMQTESYCEWTENELTWTSSQVAYARRYGLQHSVSGSTYCKFFNLEISSVNLTSASLTIEADTFQDIHGTASACIGINGITATSFSFGGTPNFDVPYDVKTVAFRGPVLARGVKEFRGIFMTMADGGAY